jgi:hypothetical protein
VGEAKHGEVDPIAALCCHLALSGKANSTNQSPFDKRHGCCCHMAHVQRQIEFKKPAQEKNYKIEGDDYNCVLCNLNIEEHTDHLFFQHPFLLELPWDNLGLQYAFL